MPDTPIPPAPALPSATAAAQRLAAKPEHPGNTRHLDHVEDDRAPHILVARYRKARNIASALLRHGADAEQTRTLGETELGRKLAADAAGTNVPSEISWALVVELVKEVRP